MKIIYTLIFIFSLWSCTDNSDQTNQVPQEKVQTKNTEDLNKAAILKVMKLPGAIMIYRAL